jgi:hypothetical protein
MADRSVPAGDDGDDLFRVKRLDLELGLVLAVTCLFRRDGLAWPGRWWRVVAAPAGLLWLLVAFCMAFMRVADAP